MPRASPIQNNFNAGEFSPLIQGRSDSPRYPAGLAKCENFIPMVQGALVRRPGSKYVAAGKVATGNTVLRPFQYSTTDAYALEFSDLTARFFTNRGQVISGTPYEVVTPYTSADLPNLKITQSLDVLYLFHPSYAVRRLLRYGATDWVLETAKFFDGPYLPIGATPGTSFVSGIITQPVFRITATTGTATFNVVSYDNITGVVNNGSGECRITLTTDDVYKDRDRVYVFSVGGTTGANGTWTAKKISSKVYDLVGSTFNSAYTLGGAASPAPFRSTDVGRQVRIKVSTNNWGWGTITSYTNGAYVDILISSTIAGAAADTDQIRLGVFSDSTGYPTCGTFHEGRLYLGHSEQVYGSRVGDFEDWAPTDLTGSVVDDDYPVSVSLGGTTAAYVRWMKSEEKGLPIGTDAGPRVIRPSSLNEAITPTNIVAKPVEAEGSSNFDACQLGKSNIYINSSTRKVLELAWFYDVDGFRVVDLTEIAEHITGDGLTTEIVAQKNPQPIIWAARADGTIVGATYKREVDGLKIGWHRHFLGGVSDTAGTPPIVKSMCVIPSPDGTTSDLWMVVDRRINGATVRYIEYMTPIFRAIDDQEDAQFVDSLGTYDSPKTITNISSANPAIVTSAAHGFSNGDQIILKDVVGVEDGDDVSAVNFKWFTVAGAAVNTFALTGLDSTVLSNYVSGGTAQKLVSSVTGLTWLEGQTVSILGDGGVVADAVVTAGAASLATKAGTVQVGLPYVSKAQLLRLEAGAADGTSFGKIRRVSEVSILVDRSASFEVGTDFDNMQDVAFRTPTDQLNKATPLFSGITDEAYVEDNYGQDNQITIRQTKPVPTTIVAIMPQIKTSDKG